MALSAMEPQLGYSDFYRPHAQKKMHTKSVYDLCELCGISSVFIFTFKLQYIHTWGITVILITGKIWILPIGAPCLDKDGACSLISSLYLWCCYAILLSAIFSMSFVFQISLHTWDMVLFLFYQKEREVLVQCLKCSHPSLPSISWLIVY